MPFDILEHLDALEPDGGSNTPRGDHSYRCPVCGSSNFKVNHSTGNWATFGCDCSASESGKKKIRNALSPAKDPKSNLSIKPVRLKQQRSWDYFTRVSLRRGQPALTVHRNDDGNGKRKIWQSSHIEGHGPAAVATKVLPYGYPEAIKALEDGESHIFWVEGEPCVDALRSIGLTAVTSLGGCGQFNPERDGRLFPPEHIVVVPDRDKLGLKYAHQVASAYEGCQWLYPFPSTPEWNGSCPNDGGLDIADWIQQGATTTHIINNIGKPKAQPSGEASGDQLRKQELKALADAAERILDDKDIPTEQRLVHLRAVAREVEISVRDTELQRFIWDARRKRAGSVDGYDPDDVIDTPDTQWLVDGVLLAGDANLVVGLPKANKTTFVLGALGAIYRGERTFLGRELATELPPIFIAGTDQPGHIWQQFLERSGLADETGRRSPHIVKMFTRERPIHLTPEGIDVMVKAAEEHPGLVFLLDSYSTLTRPLQIEENSPLFADPFIDFCEAVAPYGATPVFIHHAGKGGQGKSATFSSRGTTALPAAASQLVDVARLNADDDRDKRRIIKTEGRVSENCKILASFHGDEGWSHQGDADQVELAKKLDEAEDKLNDRQYTALEWMRERWTSGLEISQADLAEVQGLKGLDRNNRRRVLDQLVKRGLATSREVSTDKGRLKLFKPVETEMSHADEPSGVSVQPVSTALPDSSLSTTELSHLNQMTHVVRTPQKP